MPDGAFPIESVARSVSADVRRETAAKRNQRGRTGRASPSTGAPKPTQRDREFAEILSAACAGKKRAIQRLRDEYHAWITPAPKARKENA